MSPKRLCAVLICLTSWMMLGGPSAMAAELALLPAPMNEAELSRVRAGFMTLDGVTFEIGVTLQTLVNGQLALSSELTTANNPLAANSLTATRAGSSQTPILSSLSLAEPGGATNLIQSFGAHGIQNIVTTGASGQTILQNTNLTIQLAGFQQNQSQYQTQQVLSNLTSQLTSGLLLGHH